MQNQKAILLLQQFLFVSPAFEAVTRPARRTAQHVVHTMPGDCDWFLNQAAEIWVQFFVICQVGFDPLFLRHHGVVHAATIVICTKHYALGFMNTVYRIPQLAASGV